MQRYEIEKTGEMKLAEGVHEQFDENGNVAYTKEKGDKIEVITEEEYYTAFEKYSNATVVGFDVGEKNEKLITRYNMLVGQGYK